MYDRYENVYIFDPVVLHLGIGVVFFYVSKSLLDPSVSYTTPSMD